MSRWSVDGFDGHRDAVAHATFGDDDLGFGGIGLDLAAQPQHLHVYGPVVDLVVVAATHLDQLVAADHPVAGRQQRRQQVEFPVTERHVAAVGGREATGAQVQLPARDPVGAAHTRAPGILADLGAPQHRADARQQLPRAEGFGEVVVGAELKTHDAVGFLRAPRQDNDGYVGLSAQLAQQVHAVLTPQPQVEQRQVDHAGAAGFQELRARGGATDAEVVLAEVFLHQLAHRAVIVHHQYVGHRDAVHGRGP